MKIVVKQFGKIHHLKKKPTGWYGSDWWESEDKLIYSAVFSSDQFPTVPRVGDYFKCKDASGAVFGEYVKKVTFDMAEEYCIEIILERGTKEVDY